MRWAPTGGGWLPPRMYAAGDFEMYRAGLLALQYANGVLTVGNGSLTVSRVQGEGGLQLQGDSGGGVGLSLSSANTIVDVLTWMRCNNELSGPAETQAIGAAGDTITVAGRTLIRLGNATGAPITLTSTPNIADGVDGQIVYLVNDSGTGQAIVLQDVAVLGGSALRLGGANVTLSQYDTLTLVYVAAVDTWYAVDNR